MSSPNGFSAQSLESMSDEEFWHIARAQALRKPGTPSEDSARADQFIECALPRGSYLLPLNAIEEIIASPSQFTLLPAMPPWMSGISSWRGEILAIINLAAYLSQEEGDSEPPISGGLLLITRHPDLLVGIRVPAVGRTLTLGNDSIIALTEAAVPTGVLVGLAEEMLVLDSDALLADVVRQIEAEV